jgi:hypothetical protein
MNSQVPPPDDINRDLGLGSRIAQNPQRILNRDGSFKVAIIIIPWKARA